MKTRAELITDFTTISSDSSTANMALARTLINLFANRILAMKDWTFNRSSSRVHAENNEWSYPKAHNSNKIIGVKVEVDDNVYYPTEVLNRDDWEKLTRNRTAVSSDITQRYFIDTNSIELYPCNSRSASDDDIYITQFFTKMLSSRSASDYSTGLISRSASSRTVIGIGTTFPWTATGRFLRVQDEDEWYEIESVSNGTLLLTSRPSRTANASEFYVISEMIPLPNGFEDLPLWGALAHYYFTKEDPTMGATYKRLYDEGLNELLRTDSKSTGNILERDDVNVIEDVNRFPQNME